MWSAVPYGAARITENSNWFISTEVAGELNEKNFSELLGKKNLTVVCLREIKGEELRTANAENHQGVFWHRVSREG